MSQTPISLSKVAFHSGVHMTRNNMSFALNELTFFQLNSLCGSCCRWYKNTYCNHSIYLAYTWVVARRPWEIHILNELLNSCTSAVSLKNHEHYNIATSWPILAAIPHVLMRLLKSMILLYQSFCCTRLNLKTPPTNKKGYHISCI